MSAAAPTVAATRARPRRTAGIDITPAFYSRPYVTGLIVADGGMRAIGIWLASLLEMHRLSPPSITISLDELAALGGTEADAALLVQAGLWEAMDESTFSPCTVGPDGSLIWLPGRPRNRPPIPDAVRDTVYARDGHMCVICTATDDLTLDHIYPWSLGGPDTVENLRVLCRSCNSRKGDRV